MDFNWSPQMCFNCRSLGKCTSCLYITDHDVDLRRLITLTVLPELWSAFQTIISISPVTKNGFSLVGASSFLDGYELPQVTHSEFWTVMKYFLNRTNEKFLARLKSQQKVGVR